jgi:LysM domain
MLTQTLGIIPIDAYTPTPTSTDSPISIVCIKRFYWPSYRVQPGDRLFALALATGSSFAELMAANCLTNDYIYAGQLIYVPRLLNNTITPTLNDTPTFTLTDTPTDTSTPTNTATATPTDTPTVTPTDTPTATPTNTQRHQLLRLHPRKHRRILRRLRLPIHQQRHQLQRLHRLPHQRIGLGNSFNLNSKFSSPRNIVLLPIDESCDNLIISIKLMTTQGIFSCLVQSTFWYR